MTEHVTVYDRSGNLLAVLENAMEVGYRLKLNDLSTASFSLPARDPKNRYCKALNMVRLPDGPHQTGLYRIVGMPAAEDAPGGVRTYQLTHVMVTLMDDLLFGYHEYGGLGLRTADAISYILARQHTVRWQLGVCEFADQYAYKWENTGLLAALLSLGDVLSTPYQWEFDTETTPWTLHLRAAPTEATCAVIRKRNLLGIEPTMDVDQLVTRLYPLGYGEGVNQLTIKPVNGGVPYIDADTTSEWGVICAPFTDTRIEDAQTLLARARAVLEGYKNPYISYRVKALDLAQWTGQAWDTFMPGKPVLILDEENGYDLTARIVEVAQTDMIGTPGEIDIVIANAVRDVAGSISSLADRVGIGELYSQGATSLYVYQFAENCDEGHPAVLNIPIPAEARAINAVKILYKREAYRAYEQGAAAGGGSVSTSSQGGGGTKTSSAGGGQSLTQPISVNTSSNTTGNPKDMGSGYTKANTDFEAESPNNTGSSTASVTGGASVYETSAATGNTGGGGAVTTGGASTSNTGSGGGADTGNASGYTAYATASHAHSVNSHRHYVNAVDTYSSYASTSTGESDNTSHNHGLNAHSHTTSAHTHGMSHTHTGGSHTHDLGSHTHTMGHTHNMTHTHSVPLHVHGMDHYHMVNTVITIPPITIDIADHYHTVSLDTHTHSVALNAHTHELIYAIYEGTTANSLLLAVDDVPMGNAITEAQGEIDVTAALSKDSDGKILRSWHEVKLTPDRATRIVATVYAQVFVQSVGSGVY